MKLEFLRCNGNLEEIRKIWECLESVANNVSYFLSWSWIENWLVSLPDDAKPELALLREGGEIHAAFFLGKAKRIRRGLIRTRALFLNATGWAEYDRIYIEYNRILCRKEGDIRFSELLGCLPGAWDELYLPGLDLRSFPGMVMGEVPPSFQGITERDAVSPFVDLQKVRERNGDYLSLLSANTRSQIHRSFRCCEAIGPFRMEIAGDLPEALAIYDELVTIHEEVWRKRGKRGAFHSDWLFRFHRRLIEERFAAGEIQLIKARCGEETVGCLYNFVYRDHVYFYQGGIKGSLDRHLKPGYMIHTEAIRYNAAVGRQVYDFLGGEERYKQCLATHQNRLVWFCLQKPRVIYKVIKALKRLEDFLRIRREPSRGGRRWQYDIRRLPEGEREGK